MNSQSIKAKWQTLLHLFQRHTLRRAPDAAHAANHGEGAFEQQQQSRLRDDHQRPEQVGQLCAFCGSDEKFCGAEQTEF